MWVQWASLIEKYVLEKPAFWRGELTAREYRAINEMRRLIAKHPDGLAGFKGDLTPTAALGGETGNKG
jgi:hypothetical protein